MRITFVLPFAGLNGGIRVVSIYADRLRRRGHQVVVVSTPLATPTLRERIRSVVKGVALPEPPPSQSYFDGLGVEHHVIDRVRPIVEGDVPDADVVVATWWETAEWVNAFSAAKGAKAYFLQHYEAFPWQPAARVDATWRLPMHKITIAQWLVDLAAQKFGDKNVSLAPNSVDLDQFHAAPRGKQKTPTVGLMYSSASFKGCDISIQAYELARARMPGLRLVAFGGQAIMPDLALPQGADYRFQPPQERIRDIYAACDAWLFASRSEGFGLPLLEAMACRTPVIATPAGAAPELLRSGGGVLVPPEDAPAMAEAIERVCTLPESDWRRVSDAAFSTAGSFTWDDATDLFEQALDRTQARATRGEIAGPTQAGVSA